MMRSVSAKEGTVPTLDPAEILADAVDTPALVLDADIVASNIGSMQAAISDLGIALRPHAKTHKSVSVARQQIEAGARGLTVGTLGEAEVFAAAGIDDLFIAYPLFVTPAKAIRLRALLGIADVRLGVDSVAGVHAMADALGEGTRPPVLIEIECGEHRTGVSPDQAGVIARAAARSGIDVEGVFAHAGHSYQPGATAAAADDEVSSLAGAVAALADEGIVAEVVSAGSTPTVHASARPPVTEERPGTYVFGDRQQVGLGACRADEVALLVASTVVSVDRARSTITIDAGAKSLARDKRDWMDGFGEVVGRPGARIVRLYDYHGVVEVPAGTDLRPGATLLIMPNHACPVVNLFDRYVVVRGGRVVDEWDVDARGRSS